MSVVEGVFMDLVEEVAPAKINLILEVVGKYDNNYHKLETIMQSVDLCDRLKLFPGGSSINLTVKGDCKVPDNSANLVWQAAEMMNKTFNRVPAGINIELNKNIPVSAGLGGGSSDAAAVIRALNRLFALDLSVRSMEELALKLGSDVPFCIRGGTALARGRGEKLTFLPEPKLIYNSVLLIKPEFSVSTEEIFEKVPEKIFSQMTLTSKLVRLFLRGEKIEWTEGWKNDLEQITFALYPELRQIKEEILSYDPRHVLMTGSGPTLMAFFQGEDAEQTFIDEWQGEGEIFKVQFLSSDVNNMVC